MSRNQLVWTFSAVIWTVNTVQLLGGEGHRGWALLTALIALYCWLSVKEDR